MRILREAEVKERTGLSRSTRWRLERKGLFPKRVLLTSHAKGWLDDDINEWIRSRVSMPEKKKGEQPKSRLCMAVVVADNA
jgi:prophage regulatory protein